MRRAPSLHVIEKRLTSPLNKANVALENIVTAEGWCDKKAEKVQAAIEKQRQALLSQIADMARQHSHVITPEDASYPAWIRDGGTADVKGVDTKAPTDKTLKQAAMKATGAGRTSSRRRRRS